MERREVVERLIQAVKVQVDLVRSGAPAGIATNRHSRSCFDVTASPVVLSRPRADLARSVLPGQTESVVAAAESFAAGEFQFLGYAPALLPRPIRYDVDPFTGKEWPRRHGLLLDYRSTSVGDPKWIWELNRLQHIPLLLAAALLAEDERFADVAVSDLGAWLEQARAGRGIAWSNGYEPALRAISLALCLDGLRGLGVGSSTLRADLLGSLDSHVAWISRYPSLFSSANNHRIGELASVIVVASLAPELGLETAADRSLAELRERCAEQFAGDGGHREQAFGYTIFTTELLILVMGVQLSSGRKVPVWLEDLLSTVAVALAAQLSGSEPEPRYGDSDDGGPTLLGGRLGRSGRSVSAALSYGLGDRVPTGRLDGLEHSAIWLLGDGAPRATAESPVESESRWMADSGLVLLRRGSTTVTFDVGPLGFGRLAAHGHADALHVTLIHAGVLLIGDPGTGSYFGNRAMRDAFRGTGYHATVTVDGVDQAEPGGPFLWSTAPKPEAIEVDLERRTACGGHDGYTRLADAVTHRRTVFLIREGLVLVRDRLEGAGRHRYAQRWPLPPGATVEETTPGRLRAEAGGVPLLLQTACSAKCELSVREGSTDPLEGWWSERLESIVPAPLVSFEASAVGAVEFTTLLAASSSPSASFAETDFAIVGHNEVRVVCDGVARVVRFALTGCVREPGVARGELAEVAS